MSTKNIQHLLVRLNYGAPGTTDSKLGVQNLTDLNALILANPEAYQTDDIVWSVDEAAFYTIDMTDPGVPVYTEYGGATGEITFYYGRQTDIQLFLEGDIAYTPSTLGYEDGDGILCSADLAVAGNPDIAAYDLFEVTGGGAFYTWKASLAGTAGIGVPAGGLTEQVLFKSSATDFDTEWGSLTLQKVTNGGASTSASLTAADFILGSDRRLKTNIEDYVVNHIPIKYRSYELKESGEQQIGVIADELAKTHPEFVIEGNKIKMASVRYISLMMAKIAELENRIKELEK